MELYSKCVTCVMENVLQCAERIGVSERDRIKLIGRICKDLGPKIDSTSCAPILTEIAYNALREVSGVLDPFNKSSGIPHLLSQRRKVGMDSLSPSGDKSCFYLLSGVGYK